MRDVLRRQSAALQALPASVAARRAAEAASFIPADSTLSFSGHHSAPVSIPGCSAPVEGPTAYAEGAVVGSLGRGREGVPGGGNGRRAGSGFGCGDLTVLEVAVHTRPLQAQLAALAEACWCQLPVAGADQPPAGGLPLPLLGHGHGMGMV